MSPEPDDRPLPGDAVLLPHTQPVYLRVQRAKCWLNSSQGWWVTVEGGDEVFVFRADHGWEAYYSSVDAWVRKHMPDLLHFLEQRLSELGAGCCRTASGRPVLYVNVHKRLQLEGSVAVVELITGSGWRRVAQFDLAREQDLKRLEQYLLTAPTVLEEQTRTR